MKKQKALKKLVLNKEKIDTIVKGEEKSIKGGFFGSRVLCTQTNADVGCTSHTSCNSNSSHSPGSVTIFCDIF